MKASDIIWELSQSELSIDSLESIARAAQFLADAKKTAINKTNQTTVKP
jgi:hypothetical protein